MTMQDKLVCDNSTFCHIRNEELREDRVRDHCHMYGKFRDSADEVCNLNYTVPMFCSAFFQNLFGYNGHLYLNIGK